MKNSYNIATSLTQQARLHPQQKAVLEPLSRGSDGQMRYRHLSYAELDHLSEQMAQALLRRGLCRGMRVALMVPPSLDFFALTFAIFKTGAVPVFIDPGLGLKRMKRCLAEAAPEAFIGIPKAHLARLLFAWGRKTVRLTISVGSLSMGQVRLGTLMKRVEGLKALPQPMTLPDDPAAILFTSGSTGAPKGALYSHANFQAQIEALRELYQIQPGEIDLCTFPLFALFAPALGMTAIIPKMNFTKPGSVNPDDIFEPIEQFAVSNMFGSPALMRRVGEATQSRDKQLPSIKRVVSAGAPVPADVIATFCQSLNQDAKFYTPYGATEALPVASIEGQEILEDTYQKTKIGRGVCVGRPAPGSEVRIIRITDERIRDWSDELLLPTGEIGEIIVKGQQVTRSYFNRDEATQLAKIYDGQEIYHRMGDLGYFDERGRLWFCGRKAHRVQTINGNLYTIPCEAVFNTHHDVFRTALVGIGLTGQQKPVICIEVKKAKLGQQEQARIILQLREHGSKFAHTKSIETFLFHPQFPVDIRHNSKIFREKLAIWAEESLR
ncbi:MAG: fatty acid CoA ligase family protein [Oligoflexus sp.]